MILSLWFALFGILLNFFGTLLLIFSLPTAFKMENGNLYFGSGNPWDLFYHHVIKEPNYIIIFALVLLVAGLALQILSMLI
jgi:hypothetical protein